MLKLPLLGAAVALTSVLTSGAGQAQTTLTTERIIDGLNAPVWAGVTGVPGDARMFVAEQNSTRIKVFKDGVENNAPYITLSALVPVTVGGEQGLLGVAFDPNYDENGHVYLYYTTSGGASQVDRFTALTPTADRINASSRVPILNFPQPVSNHNAGWMAFGPDGYLYIATGDGGGANDTSCNAQNKANLLGNMLRIDVSTLDTTGGYSIPADNPFVGDPLARPEILHYGLRNPWRNSFDPVTGDLYIGDVGQGAREEVSFATLGSKGLNYGWRIHEGELCNGLGNCPTGTPACGDPAYTFPIQTYTHGGGNCSITGGEIYRGCAIPDLQGTYFYSDFCSNQIWSLEVVDGVATNVINRTGELETPGPLSIRSMSSFGRDEEGEILIVDRTDGEVFRIIPADAAPAECPPLIADWNALSVSSGGVQELALNAGAGNAGNLFLFAGSASGTVPGFDLGGINVPLVIDSYFNFSVANANAGPYSNTFGTLDSNGRAEAEISIPAGSISLTQVGLTLDHAGLVFDLGGNPLFVSNPVSLTFAP